MFAGRHIPLLPEHASPFLLMFVNGPMCLLFYQARGPRAYNFTRFEVQFGTEISTLPGLVETKISVLRIFWQQEL